MLIRWVNDDQRLEQAEPCWSPRGKRCSPSSWESMKTRSKQIVRKINSWGFGPWLGVKVKVGWCPLCVKGSLETRSAFRPIYKQWCVYSWVVSRNGVEFEVTAALVIWVLYIYKTPWKKKKSDFWLILKDSVHEQWHGCVCGIWGLHISSFGLQRKQDFLFSVSTPCVGLVCSSSVIPPFSSHWPKAFPWDFCLRCPHCLTALRI